MRQGLIAEWSRGIAGRGLIGAALLTVPVMVAATIGFGGAGGLSSFATGPGEGSIGNVSGVPAADRHIDSLTATTISLPTQEQPQTRATGGGQGSTLVDNAGGGTSTPVDSGSTLSDSQSGSGLSSGSTTGTGSGGATTPAQPPSSSDVVGLDINNLGGSNGQPGLVGQLLQSLNPNH